MRSHFLCFSLLLAILSVTPIAAQVTQLSDATAPPVHGVGHDYVGMLNETVNPASGALTIHIDVPVAPGRKLTVPLAFEYNSGRAWFLARKSTPAASCTQGPPNTCPHPAGYAINSSASSNLTWGGWSTVFPEVSYISYLQWPYAPNGLAVNYPCQVDTAFMFKDAKGADHQLNLSHLKPSTYQACAGTIPKLVEADTANDSYFQAALPYDSNGNNIPGVGYPSVAGPDGAVFKFAGIVLANGNGFYRLPSSIEDRNGNVALVSSSGSPSTANILSVTDSAGRNEITISTFGAGTSTVTAAGQSYSLNWQSITPSGFHITSASHSTSTVCQAVPTVVGATDPGNLLGTTLGGNVIKTISLPNGQQYKFDYDAATGFISKITYPSGGYVAYTWGTYSNSSAVAYNDNYGMLGACAYTYDTPAVTQRTVSFDGTTIALQQTFSYSVPTWSIQSSGANSQVFGNWNTKTTTVITQDFVAGTTSKMVYNYGWVVAPAPISYLADNSNGILNQVAVENSIQHYGYSPSYPLLKTESKSWMTGTAPPLLLCSFETLDNGSVSGKFFGYNTGGVISDVREYDFGQFTSGASCSSANTIPASPTPARETGTWYQSFVANPIYPVGTSIFDRPSSVKTYGNGVLVAETDYAYDETGTASVGNLPTGSHDETNYSPSYNNRGNATTITRLCLQACANAVTKLSYDETGQILSKTDPCGNATCGDMTGANHTTSYSYANNFDSNPSSNTNAYLTQITDELGHIAKFKYAYSDGQLIQSQDQNDINASRAGTTYSYSDPFRRLTESDYPDGGKTTSSYNDTAPRPSVTTTRTINSNQSVTTVTVMDGLRHPIQSQLTTDPQGTILRDTIYDGLGHVRSVSNPYRSGADPTSSPGTTTFVYDALGRKTSETEADGAVVTTAYCGPSTLVTDPVGKWRRSRGDAFGRLVEVDEPNAIGASVASTGCPSSSEPIWVTTYGYNVLDKLTSVLQNGSHSRSFTYDSFGRLLTSSNPETGAITYTYDANSNVATKKDARNITITYGYDVLNRIKSQTYSNGDPSISMSYDESNCLSLATCDNIGHRTSMTDGVGSEAWSYQIDPANQRSVHRNQRTNISGPSNLTKTSTYYFDLAGNLTSVNYPTGRTVNYTYDSANRPSTAKDSANGISYVTSSKTPPSGCPTTGACYAPQGSLYSYSIGQNSALSGINMTETYNSRLQPLEIFGTDPSIGASVYDRGYSFVDPVTGKNAGHVYAITDNRNTSRNQSFTYDQVNRIISAGTSATSGGWCWGYQYSYDAWGNLLSQSGWSPTYNSCTETIMSPVTADGSNHISALSYDVSGNATNDGLYSYSWDAESQLKSVNGVNYSYDGDGRRVSKVGSKFYWYGSGSEILAETDASGNTTTEYVYFKGQRVAGVRPNDSSSPYYFVEDLLGNSAVFYSNGVPCYDADFTPYGGEHGGGACTWNNYKFEGKERDTETGNDEFGARYYSNRFGRWLSADWSAVPVAVPYANLTNPQTLNLYAMVADDPESFADLDGHCGYDSNEMCQATANQANDAIYEGSNSIAEAEYLQNAPSIHIVEVQKKHPPRHRAGHSVSMIRGGYKWYQFLRKWSDKFYEKKTLAAEMETDKAIFGMALKIMLEVNFKGLVKNYDEFVEIYKLERMNLIYDAYRSGSILAGDLGAEPEVMKTANDQMFDFYGKLRDANNQAIDELLGEAASENRH